MESNQRVAVAVEHSRRPKAITGRRVYIGRPGQWGNPFAIGRDGTREEVIEKYRAWIAERPELVDALAAERPDVLVCWCAPQACHGDVLAELLGGRP